MILSSRHFQRNRDSFAKTNREDFLIGHFMEGTLATSRMKVLIGLNEKNGKVAGQSDLCYR